MAYQRSDIVTFCPSLTPRVRLICSIYKHERKRATARMCIHPGQLRGKRHHQIARSRSIYVKVGSRSRPLTHRYIDHTSFSRSYHCRFSDMFHIYKFTMIERCCVNAMLCCTVPSCRLDRHNICVRDSPKKYTSIYIGRARA